MPNKTYWNQVQEIMEFTDARGGLLGQKAYGERDRQETQEILRDVKERKAKANDGPAMELITLSGLAREFRDVVKETRANYRNAESEEAKEAILDEVLECTSDFFSFLAEEAAEVFGDAKKRLREAAADMEDDEWPELEQRGREPLGAIDEIEEEVTDATWGPRS